MNKKQREFLKLSTTLDTVHLSLFRFPKTEYRLSMIKIKLSPLKLNYQKVIKEEDLSKAFKGLYSPQFFSPK